MQPIFTMQYGEFAVADYLSKKIKGTVNALEDGIMYLSIPYEKGWSVWVDGEKQELVELMDAMSGVRVPAGIHEIKLRYIPEGFIAGTSLTIVSALLFVLLMILDSKKKKKLIPEPENIPEPESIPEPENISEKACEENEES